MSIPLAGAGTSFDFVWVFHVMLPVWCPVFNWQFVVQIGDIISRFEKKGFYLKGKGVFLGGFSN